MPASFRLFLLNGFVFGLAFASAGNASAQEIRVRLLDEKLRSPLGGLLVSTVDTAGTSSPAVLSSPDGIAVIHVRTVASYRLLVRRIGFAPFTTDRIPSQIAPGSVVDILVPARGIVLGAVKVVADQSCSEKAESPSVAARPVWLEIHAALEASVLSRDQRLTRTTALSVRRDLARDGTVTYTDTTARATSGDRPFFAPSPAILEKNGYFRVHDDGSEDFYAPDELVLLSDGFTRAHCLSLMSATRRDSSGTQIGLAFMPRDHDSKPDIHGFIWIDSATSELRRIEFEYVRIRLPAPADSLGGYVSFQHLASGAWIVSSWSIRMPRWRVERRRIGPVLDGYSEVGGTAASISDVVIPGSGVPRRLQGAVFDSLNSQPLVGARIHLADLDRETLSDTAGRFSFDSVGPGVHSLWVDHHALDELGLFSIGARVDATALATTDVAIAVPSFSTMWRAACGAIPENKAGGGFIFGRVRADTSIGNDSVSRVSLSWKPIANGTGSDFASDARLAVNADSLGSYVLCGVPPTQRVTLAVRKGTYASVPVTFGLGSARIARRDITVPSRRAVEQLLADTAVGGLDLQADGAVVSGVVRDSLGQPVRDAEVSVYGITGATLVDARGEFVLQHVPPGSRLISFAAPGFRAAHELVDVASTDSASVNILLDRAISRARARKLLVTGPDGRPVVYANVSLEGGAPMITDANGELNLGAGSVKALTIRVTRIGYAPFFGKIDIPDSSATATIALKSLSQQLGEVRVTGQKSPLSPFVQGFYDRWEMRQKGLVTATFIGPEELEFRHPSRISHMLNGLHGVRLVQLNPGDLVAVSSTVQGCGMAIVIDGKQQYPELYPNTGPGTKHPQPIYAVILDKILAAGDVMGVEVYARGGNMPISLQVNDTMCGVIAFWTGSRK